jgi:hypothetical protein
MKTPLDIRFDNLKFVEPKFLVNFKLKNLNHSINNNGIP